MTSTKEKLLGMNIKRKEKSSNKVSVVGVGQVGMACAFTLLVQGVCHDIALTDVAEDKLKGELLDMREGVAFLKHVTIEADTDLKVTANSKIIIMSAGVRQKTGESRLDLVQRNVEIYRTMVKDLVKHSPDAIFLVVSNPVDIMTYVTWKLSGLPAHRVIGSGTNLDSARFRHYIGDKLSISANSCHGWIIGEHGDSSVPVWSSVAVGGTSLISLNPKIGQDDDPEKWNDIHKQVVQSAYDIIKLKGYTSWAIGLSVSTICGSILRNERRVFPLSTLISEWVDAGKVGIKDEVYFSVPCVIGEEGVACTVAQSLSKEETEKLIKSAKALHDVQKDIKF